MTKTERVSKLALVGSVAAGLTLLVAGCGGSSNNGTTQVRIDNVVANGGSAMFTGTGLAPQGALPFGSATTYQNIATGQDAFSFSLSAQPTITYAPISQSINSGSLNTAFLFGRGDVTDPTDPRFPVVTIVQNDTTSPDINNTRVRAVDAAPDGPAFDVFCGPNQLTPSGTGIDYPTIEGYNEFGAGTFNIYVQITGTSTIVAQGQYTLLAGNRYTVAVTEPTTPPYAAPAVKGKRPADVGSSAVYGLQISND